MFTLTGSGTLAVTARSSNQNLLPDGGISISPGCGVSTFACTATLAPASGQLGSSTVSLTVSDSKGQTAVTSARLQVGAPVMTTGGTGGGEGMPLEIPMTRKSHGGGGSFDLVSLLGFVLTLLSKQLAKHRGKRR